MPSRAAPCRNDPALPGGISSAIRRLPDLDGVPFVVASSRGAQVVDQNGREYIDYAMAMGATLLGHAHPDIIAAVTAALHQGPMPGFSHAAEEEAAAALTEATSPLRYATFVNSGSEAVHLACRIARVISGKPLVAKAAAGYDGWYDDLTLGLCDSPEAAWQGERPVRNGFTLLRFNDCDDIDALLQERDDLAAILIEPLLANAGCLMPTPEFVRRLTERAQARDILVIADEVLTGLRLHPGLTCHKLGYAPDLATMGKAIGSGVPVAAVLGTSEAFGPLTTGKVTRAGTYNGSPLVAAAVIATMRNLQSASYASLLANGRELRDRITAAYAAAGITACTCGLDSVFSLWRAPAPPATYAEASTLTDPDRTRALHLELRRHGILTMPSPWGRHFLSFAHSADDIRRTGEAYAAAVRAK